MLVGKTAMLCWSWQQSAPEEGETTEPEPKDKSMTVTVVLWFTEAGTVVFWGQEQMSSKKQ